MESSTYSKRRPPVRTSSCSLVFQGKDLTQVGDDLTEDRLRDACVDGLPAR
jgi:hypothetical protein